MLFLHANGSIYTTLFQFTLHFTIFSREKGFLAQAEHTQTSFLTVSYEK